MEIKFVYKTRLNLKTSVVKKDEIVKELEDLMKNLDSAILSRVNQCSSLNVDLENFKPKDERTVEIFCFCQKYADSPSIRCDSPNCKSKDHWFHFSCVDLNQRTPDDMKTVKKWICPACCLSNYFQESANQEEESSGDEIDQ